MPRAAKHSPNDIYETIKGLSFVDDEGNILPYNDAVWQKASDLFNGSMRKDYVYLYLKQNRNGVFGRLHGESIRSTGAVENSIDDSIDNSQQDPNWSTGKSNCVLPPLRAVISMTNSEWSKIKSHVVEYKGREYEVLVSGWSDVIYDVLWSELKLPCPYSFKNAKINRNPGEIYLTIKGCCSECHAEINIYCVDEPTVDGATFNISTFDSRGVAHDKKRQLRGARRLCVGKELQGKSAYAWRRDEANRLMTFGDVVPANLPSEEVARKAKQETRDKELGLSKIQSVLASVCDLKYGLEFSGCIREIGYDKFYAMYWSPTQLFLYKKFLKENDFASISIDATGSLVKQIPKPDGSKSIVYLYQAVCGYREKILPLFQMISEKHDTNTLTYWIREWLRSGGSAPKQVVTDYSLALLNAASLAFNDMSLKRYVESCIIMDSDLSSVRINPPNCLIRIDIAHLIKLVTRWSCFNHESPLKKDFYLRCVGLLTMCTEIDDFVCLCTDVLSVAFATHEDIDDKESHCFAAQNRLLKRIKSYDIFKDDQFQDDILSESFDDVDQETDLESSSAIDSLIKKIGRNSRSVLNYGRLNPYHLASFGFQLLKLVKQFVLWTAVMVSDDAQSSTLVELEDEKQRRVVSSSARSEEYFRELKHLVFRKEKSIRTDKFLVIHLRSLAGTSNLLNAPQEKTKKVPKTVKHSTPRAIAEVEDRFDDTVTTSYETRDKLSEDEHENTAEREQYWTNDKTWAADDTTTNIDGPSDMEVPPEKSSTKQPSITAIRNDAEGTVDSIVDSHAGESVVEVSKISISPEQSPTPVVPSATQFLNETEDWRGLTKQTEPLKNFGSDKKTKRGKYLTACPDVELLHKRPKFCQSLPLLLNGNSLGPVKIDKKSIYVRNTCAFDSAVQSLLVAFHDFAPYNRYITESTNVPVHQFVQSLSSMGLSSKLYDERGTILKSTGKIQNGVLDCMINIASLMERFILRDVPSFTVTVRCRDCDFEKSNVISVLDINPIPIAREGMRGLQETVARCCTRELDRTQSECTRCNGTTVEKIVTGGSHVIINIETVGIDILMKSSGMSNWRKQFTLLEIPEKLNLCDGEYRFVSAIIYIGQHYFAYVKRASGKWEEHNDLNMSKKVIDVSSRTLLQQHTIHMLFYVRV